MLIEVPEMGWVQPRECPDHPPTAESSEDVEDAAWTGGSSLSLSLESALTTLYHKLRHYLKKAEREAVDI